MKTKHSINVLVVAMVALALASATSAQAAPPAARTPASVSQNELTERALHRRAIEAVIWGMPAVNFDLMYQAMVRDGHGAFNQITYWSRLPDWKIQALTPNPDAIYFTPFINTNDVGPVVLSNVYFGPKAPAGKESNWIPTNFDGRLRSSLRF